MPARGLRQRTGLQTFEGSTGGKSWTIIALLSYLTFVSFLHGPTFIDHIIGFCETASKILVCTPVGIMIDQMEFNISSSVLLS